MIYMIFSLTSFIWPALGTLILLCYIFKNFKNTEHKNLKSLIFSLALIFAMFGYCMSFNGKENDLTRYYDTINLMKDNSLLELLKNDDQMLYSKDILFYIVKMSGNVNLLAFLVGLIIYSITSYVLFDMVKRSNRKFKTYEIFLMGLFCVGILSPYRIICNVRCVLSYIIMSFAIYRDLVQKKKNIWTILLYIIPLGLHSSAIIILLIRFLSILFKKLSIVAISIALFLPKIIDFIHFNINFGGSSIGRMISNAVNKSYYYLHWTEGGWATEVENALSSKFFRFTGAIFLISILFIILFSYYKDYKKKKEIKNDNMINYLLFISVIALGTLSIKTGAFWRFESIVVLFSPVIFVRLLENKNNFNKIIPYFYIFGIIHFLINILFQINNLTGVGFITTIQKFLTTSFIEVLYSFVKGLLNLF